ncbi:MAG TPA: ABC transporter permease [Bacteroidales bacterium]|nr:ABC transporter permease [Bacteroidales bacterium]
MIKNFFHIAFRNISKNKVVTFINITGLAVGLAASLLILLWIQDELSFEKFNRNAENIYRVEEDQFYSGERYHVTVTPHPSGPVWMEKIPEIKEQTRINRLPRLLFRQEDNVSFESSVIAADSGLLKMFTLPLLIGDPETAINSPHSIVLTEKLAKKYYGKTNPIGKTITLENKYQFMVSGVMKDLPKNSMFNFEAVIPYSFLKEIGAISSSWGNNSIYTFVLLENNADIEAVNKKLTDIVLENNPETTTKFLLFPLLDIHLHGQFGFQESKGPVIVVYIFTLIAIFVLLIACINFINLSTAKASGRGKEIGIKKVAGADQMTMIIQFMLESLLLVTIAMVFSLILVGLSLGIFNSISGKSFSLSDLFHTEFIISFIVVGLLAGFISGIYPALYLSSFKPVVVLKGETVSGKGNGRLRQILVVIQFTLSILIATSAIFMYIQLRFLQEKELGFNKDNLISIPMARNMKAKYYALKRELQRETLIQGVTASMSSPVMMGSNAGGANWDGKDPEKHVLIGTNGIDYDYVEAMKMELVSGRDFSRDFTSDLARDTAGNFLVNEEVVKIMDIGDPVGKNFRFMGLNGTIVGVLKNFHFKGADQPIEPMAFALTDTSYLNVILIRLTPGNVPASLKTVEKIWKEVIPEYPLDYTFIDQDYDNLFRSQMRLTGLLKYFTILAVIIACLGLYGLSSYSAERRTNEVGIRKVMGAGSFMVMYTLSKEFLGLVIISIVIAIPLGWIIVGKLLKQFAYRIEISSLVFAGIAIGAILIALLTVSFQAYRATSINPAEALKVE